MEKPALGYLALKDLFGDEMFKKCLHGFIEPVEWETSDSLGFF